MNSSDIVTQILWGWPAVVQLAIAATMRQRRLVREFPFFFSYTVALVIQAAVFYWMAHVPRPNGALYFYWRWTAEVVDGVLKLAVVNEIYSHIFRRYAALRDLGEILFRWVLGVMVVIAVVVATMTQGEDGSRIVRGVLAFDLSATIVIGGMLFSLFLFASYLGLRWREFTFGIALGFALYTTVGLASVVTRIHWGPIAAHSYSMIRSAAYNIAIVIWMVYCLRRAPTPVAVSELPSNNLERWNQALLELNYR